MKDIAEPPIPAAIAEITKVTGPVLIFPPHTRISSRSHQRDPIPSLTGIILLRTHPWHPAMQQCWQSINAMQCSPKIHRQGSPATERAGPWAVLCASVTVRCGPAHSTHVLLCVGERGYFRGLGAWAFGRFARFER